MNKKISQFDVTKTFKDGDVLTLVQDSENKIIYKEDFETSLADNFVTNDKLTDISDSLDELDSKVTENYTDLSNKIVEGDNDVKESLTNDLSNKYDVLDNKIIELEKKHNEDINVENVAIQDWIDEIAEKSSKDELGVISNRLTINENYITQLAELVSELNLSNGGTGGSGGSGTIGYHTQSTDTIFPLTGYYKGSSANPLQSSDTLNQALSKLENQISAVAESNGSALPIIKSTDSTASSDSTIYTSAAVDKRYLRSTGDTATGMITFLEGLQGGSAFKSGWDGTGARLEEKDDKWRLELDELFVRGSLTVNELDINEIKAVGGDILVTLADIECTEVEAVSNGYKCFFDRGENNKEKYQEFRVGDLAICQKFDGTDIKAYWREVIEAPTNENYIVLSKTSDSSRTGIPAAGDKIIQLGNKTDEDRQNAIFITAKGENAPRITFYRHINSYTLADDETTTRQYVVIGGSNSKFVGTLVQYTDHGTYNIPIYRGQWTAGTTYYYYDQVTYNGEVWLCIDLNPNGITTSPSSTNASWQKQVAKGEDGAPGNTISGKQVDIAGEHLFIYSDPDYSGIPYPTSVNLVCATRGMTPIEYHWEKLANSNGTGYEDLGTTQTITFDYQKLHTNQRSTVVKCTVTDSDGEQMYDLIEMCKLCNGASGDDAHMVDLSNYCAVVPHYCDGTSKVDLSSVYTTVTAYCGTTKLKITDITLSYPGYTNSTAILAATEKLDDYTWKVYLTRLNVSFAAINLKVEVQDEDGTLYIDKTWYINDVLDGAEGSSGTDAAYVMITGEHFIHYTNDSTIPNPTEITLYAEVKGITDPVYTWYYAPAGSGTLTDSSWYKLGGWNTNKGTIKYYDHYFDDGPEITFKVVVSDQSTNKTYYDWHTINVVKDGENVYRGALSNEATTIPVDQYGQLIDGSALKTLCSSYAYLYYGNTALTDFIIQASIVGDDQDSSLVVDNDKHLIYCGNLSENYVGARWHIDFIYPSNSNTVVDTVDFCIAKAYAGEKGQDGDGKNGENGKTYQQVSAYINANTTPSKQALENSEKLPSSNSGDGSQWSLDPVQSAELLTWVTTCTYCTDTGTLVHIPGSTKYWTTPVVYSPLNGVKGTSVTSVVAQYARGTTPTNGPDETTISETPLEADGNSYVYMRLKVTYDNSESDTFTNWQCIQGLNGKDGSDGENGIYYRFRGEYKSSGTNYYWLFNKSIDQNVRDVVYYNNIYYMAAQKGVTIPEGTPVTNTTYWTQFGASFESIATGLLFAEEATIAGFKFYNTHITSQSGNLRLDGRDEPLDSIFIAAGTDAATNPSAAAFRVDTNGAMTASSGRIGGWNITRDTLVNSTGNGKINVIYPYMVVNSDGTSSTYFNTLFIKREEEGLLSLDIGSGTGIDIDINKRSSNVPTGIDISVNKGNGIKMSVEAGNGINVDMSECTTDKTVALNITTGTTAYNYVINAVGPANWYLRSGESWNMPGVLAIYRFSSLTATSPIATRVWGYGITCSAPTRTGTGIYRIPITRSTAGESIGSSSYQDYFPIPVIDTAYSSTKTVLAIVTSVQSSYFIIHTYTGEDDDAKDRDASSFMVVLVGRNTYNALN